MVDPMLHDILVHFNSYVSHILNVNPYKYNYMQLLVDACEAALTNVPGNFGVGLNLYFTNTHTKSKMEVKFDQDVIEIFSSNSGDFEFSETDVDEENAYIISDEDDEDTSDNDEGSNGSDEPIEANDKGLSDYESDNIGGKYSTNEENVQGVNVDRYMRGKMFEIEEGEKITLEKEMIFDDVYHFRTIKTLGPDHICVRVERNIEAIASWIATKFEKTLRGNPGITLEAMHDEIAENYGLETTRTQLYRGKRKAMEAIEGNHAKTCTKLPMYAAGMLRTYPSSLVKIERERKPPSNPNLPPPLPTFKRIFLSFAAIQHGFKEGCRPFIVMDGCHLKRPFWGIFLAAVGLDGNNGLYSIAIAVVESEWVNLS
ncbi:hypothetical protein ACSBR1_043162 [Camellia fascicularis]